MENQREKVNKTRKGTMRLNIQIIGILEGGKF
jgi:hypothetical protein